MKKFLTLAVAALAVLGLAAPAFAVGTPQPGDLGVFFDAAGTAMARVGVAPFVPFNMYVVSFEVPGGMEAYEFSVTVPAGAIFTGSPSRLLPAGATDFGVGDDNFIVGTGGVCQVTAGAFALVVYQGMMFLAAPAGNSQVCMAGATPSSFPNGLPGYLVCNSPGNLRNFGAAYTGCAVINPTSGEGPIPTDAQTWGSVKASF